MSNPVYCYAGTRCGWIYTTSPDQIARIRLQKRYNAPNLTGDTVIEFVYRPKFSGAINFDNVTVWSGQNTDGIPLGITLTARGSATAGTYSLDLAHGGGAITNAVTGLVQNQWQRYIVHRKRSIGQVDFWLGIPGSEVLIGTYTDLNMSGVFARAEIGDISEFVNYGAGYWDDIRVGELLGSGGVVAPAEPSPVIGQTPPTITYPISVGNEKQLFVDDVLIQTMSDLTRSLHPVQKHASNPIMIVDQPWETAALCILPLPTIYYIPGLNKYRVWYGIWGAQLDLPTYEAVADSVDGLTWTKPNLGIFSFNGSTANNILREGRMFRVNYDPIDSDPAKRYKAIIRDSGFFASFSSDGLHWNNQKPVLDQAYDATSTHWDPVGQKWIASCKIFLNDKRCRGYAESADYLNWTDTYFMFTVDALDQPSDQIYAMSIFRYESVYVGLTKLYHIATDRCDIQLSFSRDAKNWQRPDRTPFISNGPLVTDWDYGNIDDDSQPLTMGNDLWFYYAGRKELHNQMPQHGAMGMGKLRVDGFRSVDAGASEGVLTTKPIRLQADILKINTDATGGSVRVEMLEETDDTVIAPFTKANCPAITGDQYQAPVVWNNSTDIAWPARPVRLRFYVQNAKLYSFWSQSPVFTTLSGKVSLAGYSGNLREVGVVLELYNDGTRIRREPMFLGSDGSFVLSNVETGSYTLAIKSYAHLRRVIPVTVGIAPTTIPDTIVLPGGNSDGDREISSSDLSIVLSNLNATGAP